MGGKRFGPRTNARIQAMQLLFQAEANNRTVADVIEGGDYALSDGPLDPYGEQVARGAAGKRRELDAVIDVTSPNWGLTRMPAVDRNLLRVALYEMLWVDEVAVSVAISEAVELAKAFGTPDSSRFVNGLLGEIARKLEAGEDVVTPAVEEAYRRHAEAVRRAAEEEARRAAEEAERAQREAAARLAAFDDEAYGSRYDMPAYDAGDDAYGEDDGYDDVVRSAFAVEEGSGADAFVPDDEDDPYEGDPYEGDGDYALDGADDEDASEGGDSAEDVDLSDEGE